MLMKEIFILSLSLGLGYAVCVLAERQKKLMRTVGFTLGISIIVLGLLSGLFASEICCGKRPSMWKQHCMMMKHGMTMKHGKMVK